MLLKDSVEFQKLLKQGYSEDMILLAIKESDTKSFGEVSDILHFQEEHYRKILEKENLNDKGNLKKKSKKFQADKLTGSANKFLGKDLVLLLNTITTDLKSEGIDDPNDCLTKLADSLEEIRKGESNQTIKSLWKHLWSWYEHPMIQDLKDVIFLVLSTVLTMKTNVELNQKILEFCLENTFGLRLLTNKQARSLLTSCKNFNERAKFWDDIEFVDRLEEIYEGFDWANPLSWESVFINRSISYRDMKKEDEEDEEEKISEEQKKELIAKARAKEKRRELQEQRERVDEERKFQLISKLRYNKDEVYEDEFEADESSSEIEAEENKEQEKEEKKFKVMEECLICMKNIREIVFLPCCHFLTCSDCSLKVNKCPLCSKEIEKNQKIYWS